jgi:F-type H+-transporting ATPase subunit delta
VLKESIARRYSAALFALAQDTGKVKETVDELDRFVDALQRNPDLDKFFASPVIARDVKCLVLHDSLHGKMSELTINFLTLLARKRREGIVTIVARQLHELLDASAGRAVVAIDTPRRMTDAELAALARRLSGVYQRQLIPQQKVAPELLGGVVVQVGDRYVDASVAGRLEELRRQLLAAGEKLGAVTPDGKV